MYKLYNLTTAEIKILKNEMDKDKEEIQTLLQQIRDESSDTEYIYRGETQEFPKISSTLYRKYENKITANKFDINTAQKEVLKNVKEYISFDKAIDPLIELQHYGGKTNLIDFSTDYLVALFFACNAAYNQDGRLILLNKSTHLGNIITPRNITTPASENSRIRNQKSIFLQPPEGFIAEEKVKILTIKQKLKQPILSYLKECGITTASIYNDLLGYIQNQDQHKDAYTQFYIGLTHQNKAEKQQQDGKYADAQEERNKAITDYTAAIKLKPDDAAIYNNRGTVKAELEQYQEASADYTTAIKLNPDYAEAYNNRGAAKVALGQYPEAITDYTTAIKLNPDYAEAYNNRGATQAELGQYQEAITDHTVAIELKPDYAEAYYHRGNAQVRLKQYPEAITAYTTAIELNPNYAEAYNNRGGAKADLGQYPEAIIDYTTAIKLNPDYATFYNNRGHAQAKLEHYPEAITDYTETIKLKPDYAEAYINRGLVQTWLGRYPEAITDHTTAIKLNPDYAEAYNNRGLAQAGLGRHQEAIADYTTAIERNPDDATAYISRGLAKAELGQHQQARADYTAAMNLAKKQDNQALIDFINLINQK